MTKIELLQLMIEDTERTLHDLEAEKMRLENAESFAKVNALTMELFVDLFDQYRGKPN